MRFALVGWGLRFWLLGVRKGWAMAPDEALALTLVLGKRISI